jgi:hypothetical protein
LDFELENMSTDSQKKSIDGIQSHEGSIVDLPPDPDAHLSPEEKVEMVCVIPALRAFVKESDTVHG